MKKVVASLLTLTVALTLSTSVFAAEPVKNLKSSKQAATSVNDPYEPNDDPAFATYINSNISYNAAIGHDNDTDAFKVYAKAGEFKFSLSNLASTKERIWVILHQEGTNKVVHQQASRDGKLSYTVNLPAEGTYVLYINPYTDPIQKPVPYAFKAIFNQ